MRLCCFSAMVLAAAMAGCMKERPFIFAPEALLPKPVHSHPWVLAGEPETYTSETLSDYINGAARPYVEYGMRELIHAMLANKADPSEKMVVDIYEMVSPLAAYGIFSSIRPEGVEGVGLGTLGFWSGGLLCFVKDRIFVSIAPPGEGPGDYASAMLLGGYIEDQIRLSSAPPKMIQAFPDDDRVKQSIKYIGANMLGHRFLGAGWQATYRYRGVNHDAFVIPCDSSEQAIERFEKLADTVAKGEGGEIVRRVPDVGRAALVARGKLVGRLFLACSGKYLAGTLECYEDERSIRLTRQLLANIARLGL